MYLKRIKLAGFKSFVDSTTIPFQSHLTAIVGPNGCGKSNIIDAMRWVLGEASAKQLRGESMRDVIFNGAASRKPLGQAVIEVVFDNQSARLGGEYAGYNEIAVRREITRDGISNYYINGTRCRRKDVVDIFLGTGLGPNSYAIIEQGMIAELIEAKPDQLRLHLEEAAGISKYKERRRETENRIEHTRENLLRINDIKLEIDNQLKVLKRQANAANAYKRLREEERQAKAHLQLLHWYVLNTEIEAKQSEIAGMETTLNDKIIEQQVIEASLTALHQQQISGNDAVAIVQKRFYQVTASISELEQQIFYSKKECSELQQSLERLQLDFQEVERNKNNDLGQIKLFQGELAKLKLTESAIKQEHQDAEQQLLRNEETLRNWQSEFDNFNASHARQERELVAENARLKHFKERLSQESLSSEKCKTETAGLNTTALETVISELMISLNNLTQQETQAQDNLILWQRESSTKQNSFQESQEALAIAKQNFEGLNAKKMLLESLMAETQSDKEHVIENLFKNKELNFQKQYLAQKIEVSEGWERAIEMVLGYDLKAICIDDWATLESACRDAIYRVSTDPGTITFMVRTHVDNGIASNGWVSLSTKIKSTWPVAVLLDNIFIADNLEDALNMRPKLGAHESVITQHGIWLGTFWLKISSKSKADGGIVKRTQELALLTKKLPELQAEINKLQKQSEQQLTELKQTELRLAGARTELQVLTAKRAEVASNCNTQKIHLEHAQTRLVSLTQEIVLHTDAVQNLTLQIQSTEQVLAKIAEEKCEHDTKRTQLLAEREQHHKQVITAKELARQRKEAVTAWEMRLQLLLNQINYLEKDLARIEKQLASFYQRKQEIIQKLANIGAPDEQLTPQLNEQLQQKLLTEKELAASRSALTEIENNLRVEEQKNSLIKEAIAGTRNTIDKLKTANQELKVQSAIHVGQIEELGFKLENLLAEKLVPLEQNQVTEQVITDKIGTAAKRIERLGLINLAAISEYEKQKERSDYLAYQIDDLAKALVMLEDAIRKIDQETRTKFQTTFAQVNTNLQALFPKIFGGGHAKLQLTADDFLTAGVVIIAQPPGKCNTNIQSLSGGEKALTAIALIFAIFQINPAPFCLLDEVDAPFDDENVARFCRLIKEMSEAIQFIYISHNKATMEIAGQLLGVTMHEPGVSRIVSVDIAQAMSMVEN